MRALISGAIALLTACGDSTSATPPATVDSSGVDATSEAAMDGPPIPDTGMPEVLSHGMTTGMPCTTDAECDVTGEGVNICSDKLFSYGSFWPDPICVGRACELGAFYCDGRKGVCVEQGAAVCLPVCTFRGEGAPITECVGLASCSFVKLDKDGSGAFGIGFCKPACRSDDQCKRGHKCQRETGICLAATLPYTGNVGDPCVGGSKSCRCSVNGAASGYCTTSCVVGDSAGCPAGFVCYSQLRRIDPADGSTLFAKDPPGLGGTCAKTCTKDADCAAYGGGRCEDRTSGKVCLPL